MDHLVTRREKRARNWADSLKHINHFSSTHTSKDELAECHHKEIVSLCGSSQWQGSAQQAPWNWNPIKSCSRSKTSKRQTWLINERRLYCILQQAEPLLVILFHRTSLLPNADYNHWFTMAEVSKSFSVSAMCCSLKTQFWLHPQNTSPFKYFLSFFGRTVSHCCLFIFYVEYVVAEKECSVL